MGITQRQHEIGGASFSMDENARSTVSPIDSWCMGARARSCVVGMVHLALESSVSDSSDWGDDRSVWRAVGCDLFGAMRVSYPRAIVSDQGWRDRFDWCIVFVEVKTWGSAWENSGGPSDAVDAEKQRKITQTALIYCKRHGLLDTSGRADVIEVTFEELTRRPIFRHIENAFEAVGSYQLYS
jgi:Holliday junction resolvase-like predicted endonuclease